MNHYRHLAQLDKSMDWTLSFYRLLDVPRPIGNINPKNQIVKDLLPKRSFTVWPPSVRRSTAKKGKKDEGGDDDAKLEDDGDGNLESKQ